VDHVIAPLDPEHARVVAGLARELAAALALDPAVAVLGPPHVTLVSYSGIEPGRATLALAPTAAAAPPFTVRAHGYGIFTGDADRDLSLHVVVVRTQALDALHGSIVAALGAAGASLAGTTQPHVWTPHITLLDRGLTPRRLGLAVEVLACRPHRSWSIRIESLAIARRRHGVDTQAGLLALGAAEASVPPS
jgi:2'-5' RNA ligase